MTLRRPGLLAAPLLLAGCLATATDLSPTRYTDISRDIVEAAFSTDGNVLATVYQTDDRQRLALWRLDADDAHPLRSWALRPDAALGRNLLLSADGRQIVMPEGEEDTLAVIDAGTGTVVSRLALPDAPDRPDVSAGAFGPGGTVALAGADVMLFETASGRRIATAPLEPGRTVDALTFAPNGAFLFGSVIARDQRGTVIRRGALWDGRTLRPMADFAMQDGTGVVIAWDFLPGRDALAFAATDATLRVMRLPDVVETTRHRPCGSERLPCVWLDPLVAGPNAMLGLGVADVNRTRNGFLVLHLDGETLLPMLEIDLYADVAHALGVSADGQWRIAATSGVLRFGPIGPEAVRLERLVAEATRHARSGRAGPAGERLFEALAIDAERLGERGADVMADVDPAIAGEIERRRAILLGEGRYTAYANGRPLFVHGYLALMTGHPDVARAAAARLGADGAIPVQFDTPALGRYLEALIAAWEGDIDGGFAIALSAREIANPDVVEFLGQRIRAHPQAWGPLLSEPNKLVLATGVPLQFLPTVPDEARDMDLR
jgi:hypothetical protein